MLNRLQSSCGLWWTWQ